MKHPALHLLLLLLLCIPLRAQDLHPLNQALWQQTERIIQHERIPVFTSLKPVPEALYMGRHCSDSLRALPQFPQPDSWVGRKMFHEDLVSVKAEGLQFRLNPLMDFSYGQEKGSDEYLYRNTRGFMISGTSYGRISFSTAFYENQGRFPSWMVERFAQRGVVPGQGAAKAFGTDAWDFAWSEGHLMAEVFRGLLLELGYGKTFFGDGYCSLIQSDYAFVHPYLGYRYYREHFFVASQVSSYIDRIKPDGGLRGAPRKTSAWHSLGYRNRFLEISLVEANMYSNPDSSGRFRWQTEFFNPLPFFNSIAGRGNNLFGFNLKIVPWPSLQLYGQLLLDEADTKKLLRSTSLINKTGFQAGFKYFDVLTISGLYLQAEYNQVRPWACMAESVPQSWTHYNEPLQHPLGANFRELILRLDYRAGRFLVNSAYVLAVQGSTGAGNGTGIELISSSTPLNTGLLDAYPSDIRNADLGLAWLVNPAWNMQLGINFHYRVKENDIFHQSARTLSISLRTALNNFYSDF
ncbi:MAG: hypothetical protein U0T82_04935 [Bacteroidales bacterium]